MQPLHPSLAHAFALSQAGRNDEALALIERLAGEGEPGALFTLGDLRLRGELVAADPPHALALFRRASDAGHAMAARATTNLLASGLAGTRDWPGALARLAEEAQGDLRRAQMLALIEAMDLDAEGDPRSLPEPRRLSESPDVLLFPRLFTPGECDFLMLVAEPSYAPSLVIEPGEPPKPDPFRTSDGALLGWMIEDPVVHALNRRIAAVSGTAAEQGESLQILRYLPGQEYRSHFDHVPGAANQRVLTALVYLNEDYAGGETCFVRTGLKVRGGKGDALLFRNTGADRRADPMSEHAGLPVTHGAKYLASRWIRERGAG